MFGRATIRLDIGPHSSFVFVTLHSECVPLHCAYCAAHDHGQLMSIMLLWLLMDRWLGCLQFLHIWSLNLTNNLVQHGASLLFTIKPSYCQ